MGSFGALAGDDDVYPFGQQKVTFPAFSSNGTTICFGVSIHDDDVVENQESFSITLEVLDESLSALEVSSQHFVIADNDGKFDN